jgi:membrane-bound metal-dependent hydrolase YbcI (DUF457 family)
MFIGHFALGFAAKRWAPRVSLALLFGAAQLADFLWPVFLAIGIEQVRIDPGNTASTPLDFVSYPYSHSLVALMCWGALLGWICRRKVTSAHVFAIVAALVASHWLLDFITHRPDMPLYPGGRKVGLGLWNHPLLEKTIEVAIYAAGIAVYLRATRARDRAGRWGFIALAVFLIVGFLASGQPPPSVTALWTAALVLGALILVWAWWVDRHRIPVGD